MLTRYTHSLAAIALLAATPTLAAPAAGPRCMMRVTGPTPAVENPSAVLKAGTRWGPVTQIWVDRKTGAMRMCAHGDYCYPATHLAFDTACAIVATPVGEGSADPEAWLYEPR